MITIFKINLTTINDWNISNTISQNSIILGCISHSIAHFKSFFHSNVGICVVLILCITSCVNLSILVLLIGWVVNWYPKTHLTTELMKPWENRFHQNVFLHLHYITMKAICCIYFLRMPEEISLTIFIADCIRRKHTLNVYDMKSTEIVLHK